MKMMRSNHKYNCNDYSMTIPHEAQCSSTVSSICSLVKQFMPTSTSSPTPRAKSHCKINRTETRPIQHKKQVRRRCHTTKPYQEQLLNMAEARKEIVTALKFHRASMKKQQQHQHQQQNMIIPSLKHQVSSKQPKPQLLQEQPTLLVQDYVINMSVSNCLGSTPYPLEGVNSEALQVGHEMEFKKDQCKSGRGRCKGGAVEPRALDEEEMAEIRSIGEKHQVEWDDTLNLATYARWFKFLEQMEISEEGGRAYTL